MKLVETSRKSSPALGHKRRVLMDNTGVLYLECNNPECEEPFKTLESFPIRKKGFKGKRDLCSVCNSKYTGDWAKKNKEKVYANNARWQNNNKERVKEYWKKSNAKWYQKNKEYKLSKNAEWIRNNRKLFLSYNRKWQLANPDKVRANWNKRRVRLLNAPNTIDPTLAINQFKEVYGSVCGFTGLPLCNESIEHLVPVSHGGGNTEYNLYPAESLLNISKGNRNVFDWIEKRSDIDFTFFFENTLPYLANQINMSVEEFTTKYNKHFKELA
jgi:hypothetical protein